MLCVLVGITLTARKMAAHDACLSLRYRAHRGFRKMDRRFQKRIARYLTRQERNASTAISRLDMASWFDLYHTHLDWKSKANRAKPMVALLTYKLLQQAEASAESRREPIQVWATLCENTGDNAIYLHSQNPNQTEFPYTFDGVEWGVTEPPEAQGIINSTHEIGRRIYDSGAVYFIRRKEK